MSRLPSIFRRKRAIPRVERLEVGPNDALLVTVPDGFGMDQLERIREGLDIRVIARPEGVAA